MTAPHTQQVWKAAAVPPQNSNFCQASLPVPGFVDKK